MIREFDAESSSHKTASSSSQSSEWGAEKSFLMSLDKRTALRREYDGCLTGQERERK